MSPKPHSQVGRLFIVGCPRSGTTLLQCLLAAHSEIVSLPETDYFVNLESGQRRFRLFGITSSKHEDQYARFRTLVPTASDSPARMPRRVTHSARVFVRTMDALAQREGKSFWLEKSPYHTRSVDVIERHVSGARFIHNIRSGPDNIASLYDMLLKYPEQWNDINMGLEECIDRWLSDVRHSLRCVGRPNHLFLGYHQVVQDTCSTLKRVCAFAGLPFEPSMLEGYKSQVDQVATQKESWKAGVRQPIANRNGTKFYELFTPEQQNHILKRVSEVDLTPLGLC
jgi:hypothetical protein